jgi:CRISPR-associated protein Cmr1
MRFWFRALAGSVAGPDQLAVLAKAERAVFGGIPDQRDKDEAAVSSPLILRLPDPPRQVADDSFLSEGNRAGLRYLLGLGLMKPRKGGADLVRSYVPPGEEFQLKVGFRHGKEVRAEVREAVETLAFASLWLMSAYGGLGARTRRGLGGVRITDVSGSLPGSWKAESLITPGLGFYERATWLLPLPAGVSGVFNQHFPALMGGGVNVPRGPLGDWEQPPPFPVIAKKYVPAALSKESFRSWEETLSYAGRQWRLFRANRPENDLDARNGLRVRTAEWDDVIHGDQAGFPLGALGLPVGFQDKESGEKFEVNAAVPKEPKPDEPLRRASPMWLRAVGSGQSWRLFSFAFQSRFLPGENDAKVYLFPDDELTIGQDHVAGLTGQWLAAQRDGRNFARVIRA